MLVGHSYGGGVALSAASLAPHRVEAVILLASVGPGCVNVWDRLLAAPGAGPLCALLAWRLTPWIARARLARIGRRRASPLRPDEHVNWQVWGHTGGGNSPVWRTFLAEQRALLRELGEWSTPSGPSRRRCCCSPTRTTSWFLSTQPAGSPGHCRTLACSSSRARHHLPRRAPGAVADAMAPLAPRPPGTLAFTGAIFLVPEHGLGPIRVSRWRPHHKTLTIGGPTEGLLWQALGTVTPGRAVRRARRGPGGGSRPSGPRGNVRRRGGGGWYRSRRSGRCWLSWWASRRSS